MSLPTPPKTSHREKENRTLAPGSRGVVWSQHNQIHCLSTPPNGPSCSSALNVRPAKSILKQTQPLLPLIDEDTREDTPEPSDPLSDSRYLETPISTIVSEDSTLSDLIKAYSTLTARMRPYVSDWTNSTSPLFNPLRANRDALTERICRDLGRALVDAVGEDEEERLQKEIRLPSPTKSPKKKKRGMTAEQAKHARDLCTTCHSVLKLLGLLLTLPAIYRIFTDAQLAEMLSHILAIPLAKELPTPNARKTCALSIFVIQTQRLPSAVLRPAAHPIAHALGRGIDGELGKEGKKGAASDGLKAIHGLSVYLPLIFIPAFSILIDSLLDNLIAPTLALRVQACHALGGLALGASSIPISNDHTRIASRIADFLLTLPTHSSPSKKGSPTSPAQESLMCRTLRTTLNAQDPVHVAQGPVWGLSVMASFIVLLGSTLTTDPNVSRVIASQFNLVMRHKKSSVRALACIVLRTVTWAFFSPSLPLTSEENAAISKSDKHVATAGQWNMIESVLTMGAGISSVCAAVGSEMDAAGMKQLERLLTRMLNKNEETKSDALQMIGQLVSSSSPSATWDIDNLLSGKLFSAIPGLLTVEFKDLAGVVRSIRDELPTVPELRGLSRDELTELGALNMFFRLWSRVISVRSDAENNEELLLETWESLVKAALTLAEDEGEEGEGEVVKKIIETLLGALRSRPEHDDLSLELQDRPKQQYHFDMAKNLRMIHKAWTSACTLLSNNLLDDSAPQFLECLMKYEDDRMSDIEGDVRNEWAALCVEFILACSEPESTLSAFWSQQPEWNWGGSTTVRTSVWTRFMQLWQESKRGTWDGALILLGVPLSGEHSWDLDDDELTTWEQFLTYTVNKGIDYGLDAIAVVNDVARRILEKCNPTFTSLARVSDMLLGHVDLEGASSIPEILMELVADTLRQSYPPSPSERYTTIWVLRSLGRVVNSCSTELYRGLLEIVQESLVPWISDDHSAIISSGHYDDVLTLYEHLLMKLAELPQTEETLQMAAPLLDALFEGAKKPEASTDAFDTFWMSLTTYERTVPAHAWPLKVQEYFNGSLQEKPRGYAASKDVLNSDHVPSSRLLESPSDLDTPRKLILPQDSETSASPLLLPAPTILVTPPRAKTPAAFSAPSPRKTPGPRQSPLFTPITPSATHKHPIPSNLSPLLKASVPSSPGGNKRRRISGKENESPCAKSPSQACLDSSPRRVLPHTSLKRRSLADGADDEERPTKKVRIDSPLHRLVLPQSTTQSQASSSSSLDSASGSSDETETEGKHRSSEVDVFGPSKPLQVAASKKRKAMLLDCVEITMPRRVSPKSTRMITTLSSKAAGKRKASSSPCCSPERPDMLDIGSDDSIMQMGRCPSPREQQLSSDDDPHLGQVTPGHLISPALRRVRQDLDDDPPSDDSVTGPASPSREAAMRRLQRSGSVTGGLRPMNLAHLMTA